MMKREIAVEQHVAPERPPGERPALPLEGEQKPEDQQLRAGFVELRRVERHVQRRADVLRRELAVKRDRPGHVGRTAEAAAGEQAAETADDVAERDAGREHVGRGPHRHPVPPQVPQGDGDGRDQPAVEHAARARQVRQSRGAQGRTCRIDDEQQQLRADQRADDDPDPEVHDPVRIQAARPGPDQRELQAEQVGGGEQQPVGVDREAADLKQDGMHAGVRARSCRAAPGSPRR